MDHLVNKQHLSLTDFLSVCFFQCLVDIGQFHGLLVVQLL